VLLIYALWQAIGSVPALAQPPLANTSSWGAWSSTDLYMLGPVVNYGGTNYIALTENVGVTPDSTLSDWAILDSVRTRSASEKSAAAELTGPVGSAIAGGASAPAVTYKGPYVAGRRYSADDVVTEKGTRYIAVTDGAREDPANDFSFSLGNWAVFSPENPRWTASAMATAATAQFNGLNKSTPPQALHRPAELTPAQPANKQHAQGFLPGCNNVGQQVDPFYQSGHLGADCGTTIRSRTDYGVIGTMLIWSLLK